MLIYTTNAIEGFNCQLRKVTKNKGVFPTDDSLLKMLYLAISDDDIKTTNKYLEMFYKNLDWDLGFTLKIISLEFYRMEGKGYSIKKELVDKIEKLLKEYVEIPSEKTLIEKY